MSDKSQIEWTEVTWNTVYGCTKVSPGCAHCYIERAPPYRQAGLRFERGRIPLLPERLDLPLRWKRPRLIFVNSLSDTFHEDVPDEFIFELFGVMALARHHTFQVLTKRPERMRSFVSSLPPGVDADWPGWPLPNVWLGTTAENQRFADIRIPELLATPAAVRFVSCEPLMGPVDLRRYFGWRCSACDGDAKSVRLAMVDGAYINGHVLGGSIPDVCGPMRRDPALPALDWIIAGGESGPGRAARKLVEWCGCQGRGAARSSCVACAGTRWRPKPQALWWVRSLRDQCVAAGIPWFFKQWAGPRPTSGGRLLDGREWSEMPTLRQEART